ncbi:MAG: hypothetical protein IPM21_08365 [Acidobacteria bacterium]|nr:hypothetical protein [Acidobacteriota bacterium]
MGRKTFTFFMAACVLFWTAVMSVSGQSRVSNFSLQDQNDRKVEVNFPSDRPVVFVFGDRDGAKQIDGWATPLYKKFDGKVYMFGIASLGGVPSYARGLVRRLIKRQTQFPVLLDWGGKVAKTYGYEKDKAMVLVVARNGNILSTKFGAASEAELNAVIADIEKQLR